MSISTEQRAWLKGLGDIIGGAPGADEEEADDGARDAQVKRRRLPKQALADTPVLSKKDGNEAGEEGDGIAEPRFGFGPEDILPVIPDLIDDATDRRATCAIHNNTQQVLKLDTASLSETDDDSGKSPGIRHGKFVTFPPSQIAASDQSGRFVAENNKVLIFSFTGVEATLKYILDPQGTAWVIHFENPFGVAAGTKNSADARVEGPNAAQFESPKPGMSGKNDVKYLFILNAKGGAAPVPVPVPTPQPGPAANVPSSCLISIVNLTEFELSRAEAEHERGDFMVPPPRSVAPGAVVTISSVETPGAKEQGCKGFIVWEVGSPVAATWRVDWDNPENAKNNSTAVLSPAGTGFKSQDVIGQGEDNVPVSFTISGGGAPKPEPKPEPKPGPKPEPKPEPEPEPDLPFVPPIKTKQPTFRKGDKSKDGWVEYAQMLLNFHLGTQLKQDGDFGNATLAAVLKFQKTKKLQIDGTLGNQTWAALREGAPEKPSTDGRKPHTFVEKGVEARWSLESDKFNFHFADDDELFLSVDGVGDTPIDASTEATLRVTPPGGKPKVIKAKLGPGAPKASGDGAFHTLIVKNFRKTFPSVPANADVSGYLIEGFLPEELGGDSFSSKAQAV